MDRFVFVKIFTEDGESLVLARPLSVLKQHQ